MRFCGIQLRAISLEMHKISIYPWDAFKSYSFKITLTSPSGQWVKLIAPLTLWYIITISQHRSRQWLVTWWHQAVTWTTTDLLSIRSFNILLHLRCKHLWIIKLPPMIEFLRSSPPGQNGRHFSKSQFQMHFLEWKWHNSNLNFTEICSHESIWQ